MNWFKKHMHKQWETVYELNKNLNKTAKLNNYKSWGKQTVPQCKAWQDECSKPNITEKNRDTQLLGNEAQQNPEDLGQLQVNKENPLLSFRQ